MRPYNKRKQRERVRDILKNYNFDLRNERETRDKELKDAYFNNPDYNNHTSIYEEN